MKIYVAVTDNDWYRFLSRLNNVEEVNFWQPGGSSRFHILKPGEPFLFKLHSPQNFIAGGGFFTYSSILPVSLAWEAFGEKNGAATFEEMRSKILTYRGSVDPHQDFQIGCILVQRPFFFSDNDWIPVPRDFSLNIVQGKTYDMESTTGQELWDAVRLGLRAQPAFQDQVRDPETMWRNQVLVRQQLGQGAFRVLVTDTYERHCAVTQEKALPALEATHIRPVAQDGKHRIDNGLLLRSDIHKLFDAGYVTVTPDFKFRASHKLEDDFHNGEKYVRLQGSNIWLPRDSDRRPNREFLEWHSDTVFRPWVTKREEFPR